MSRRLALVLITLLLILAAAIRFHSLAVFPTGFNDQEIDMLRIAETTRTGRIGVFYNAETSGYPGRESIFPIVETVTTGILGDGLLTYRIVPMWAGLLSVALIYALGRRLFGRVEGFVAALLFTAGLWPVLLSRSVLAEALLLPVALSALLALAHALHLHRTVRPLPPATLSYAALGALTSLAAYIHWTGLMLVPIFTAFFVYLRGTLQPISRRVRGYSLFGFLVALILGIPYFTSTLRAPILSGFGSLWAQRPASIFAWFGNVFRVAGALFRFADRPLSFLGVLLVLMFGSLVTLGIRAAIRNWQTPAYLLTLIVFIGGLLPAFWTGRGDFTLTLAFPGMALLIGIGVPELANWLKKHSERALRPALTALVPLVAVAVLLNVQTDFFGVWPTDPTVSAHYHGMLGHLAVYLDSMNDSIPTLICSERLVGSAEYPVPDTALLDMMLHRAGHNLRFSNCNSALVLADGGHGQRIVFSASSDQPPLILKEWMQLGTVQPISIPGLRDRAYYFEIEQPLADALGRVTLSHVTWPPELPNPEDPVRLPVRMGDYLSFEGYRLEDKPIFKPGDIIALTTFWRIDGGQAPDLRLFVHMLLDPNSEPVAQVAELDVAPSYLRDRDILIQFSRLQLPYPFPEGNYYLSVGAFHDRSKARVPIFDERDQIRGDRLFLGTISVKG